VSCPSAQLCVGAGVQGQIITSTSPATPGTRWKDTFIDTLTTINGPFPVPLGGISCPSVKLCVATDELGNVFTSRHPTGPASAWSRTNIDSRFFGDPLHPSLSGISCPTVSLCVAVDAGGNALSSTDPTGGTAAWTRSNVAATALRGVSCPSASLCVAVDAGGDVLTSQDPTGGAGAWTVAHVDPDVGGAPVALSSISCPSTSRCVIVDSAGHVFTSHDATSRPSTWTSSLVTPHAFSGVSCGSSSFCVAIDGGGNAFISRDPSRGAGAWAPVHIDSFSTADCGKYGDGYDCQSGVNAISCPTASFCAAVDSSGDEISSADPGGGPSAWSGAAIDPDQSSMNGISCPSRSLCVAADGYGGRVITSTDPADAPGAWISTTLAPLADVTAVSCASASFCVALGNPDVYTTTDPTGGASKWVPTPVDMNSSMTGVSCPSASFCIGVDSAGNAFVGTPRRSRPRRRRHSR
jgi:hypothetical protein